MRYRFHWSRDWKKARRVAKITAGYTCQRCGVVRPGKGQLHVHHRKPVARSMALALEPLNFEVVCPACHNIIEPRDGSPAKPRGCDIDGRPLDPNHPWLKGTQGGHRK
jgi:5-methylcytosine-specific restriction endonuclease McrA